MTDRELQQTENCGLVEKKQTNAWGKRSAWKRAVWKADQQGCPPVVLAWGKKVFKEAFAAWSGVRAALRFVSRAKNSLEVVSWLL